MQRCSSPALLYQQPTHKRALFTICGSLHIRMLRSKLICAVMKSVVFGQIMNSCLQKHDFQPQIQRKRCVTPENNKPFWHLSKSAYRYSWFTCKQTIERTESAVKKIENAFYGLESSLYLFFYLWKFVDCRNHFHFFTATYNSLFTNKPRIPIEMSIGLIT